MGTNHVELEEFITPELVEYAHGAARRAQENAHDIVAQVGMRAARARDPKLLKALERGAEIMDRLSESQMGQTRRSLATDVEGYKVEHTETQLWKKAYEFADRGEPLQHFCWIYGAAAIMCGYVR